MKAPQQIPFADASVVHAPGGEVMAFGIFGNRSDRWGPGKGIFESKWAIPEGIYETMDYAGGRAVDAGKLFREHGVYGLGAEPLGHGPFNKTTAAIAALAAYFLARRMKSTTRLALAAAAGVAVGYATRRAYYGGLAEEPTT